MLFIGESPPKQGTFFYCGDSNLYNYTKEAFEQAFERQWVESEDFLTFFKESGCYLVDLCDEPVNHLPRPVRKLKRQEGIPHLAREIAQAKAVAHVVVMKDIDEHVLAAVHHSGSSPETRSTLPFPAQGNQRRYVDELTEVLGELKGDGTLTGCE